jgi:magnesium transporter
VLELISPEKQLQIFEELDGAQSLKMLSLLASESATNVLKQLAPEKAKKFLEDLPRPKSLKIIELLHYAEGTVGSIMTNNVVFLRSDITVSEARKQLSERMNEANFVYLIYTVTDEKSRRLDGLLSLRNIIAANAEDKLSDIHDSYVTVLHPLEEAAVASFRVIDSHLAAMPVTNQEGKLLGVLTIDAAVSAVAPRAWRDVAPRIFS